MHSLHHLHTAEEDWSGLKDRKARRKLQNRLNVRAHRLRKSGKLGAVADAPHHVPCTRRSQWLTPPETREVVRQSTRPSPQPPFSTCQRSLSYFHSRSPLSPVKSVKLANSEQEVLLIPQCLVEAQYWELQEPDILSYISRYHAFPLSSDHLIPLVQYNLVRASITNAAILSLLQYLPDGCEVIHTNMPLFPRPDQPGSPVDVPPSLMPTQLQKSADHEYWVDLVPDPTMRDNMIRALADGTLDPVELQADLFGAVCPQAVSRARLWAQRNKVITAAGRRRGWSLEFDSDSDGADLPDFSRLGVLGIVAWSTPWCADGYELSEALIFKYRDIMKGCGDMLNATNRWRQSRGEEPIVLEL